MALYSQVPFLKMKCTENAKSTIKNTLKSEKKKKKHREKYREGKKWTERKKDIMGIQSQENSTGKRNIRKILNIKKDMKKREMFVNSSAKVRI